MNIELTDNATLHVRGKLKSLCRAACWALVVLCTASENHLFAQTCERQQTDSPLTLPGDGFELYVDRQQQPTSIQLRSLQGQLLAPPPEGLWSIATGWEKDWPTNWIHGNPQSAERIGPWLVLHGKLSTPQGDWLVRDSYRSSGALVRCIRRWTWTGKQTTRPITLSVRWQVPTPGGKPFMPGICLYGNPSGVRTGKQQVPAFSGATGEELYCEEHRFAMPYISLEWEQNEQLFSSALHSVPSYAHHGHATDHWWSMGVAAHEQATEFSLLSGPCSINRQRGFVKANQSKMFEYTDTWLEVPPGAVIEKTFLLQANAIAQRGTGFQKPMRDSIELFHPYSLDGLPTFEEILEAKYRFTLSRWHEDNDSAGIRMYPNNNSYVMGWAGQSDSPGYALLVLANQFEQAKSLSMAQRLMDHLSTAPFNENGFQVRYNPDNNQWSGQDPISQGQAMENFARAILAGRKLDSINTKKWETFLRHACDIHAQRILRDDWRPRSTNEGFLVSPLCKAFQLFGNPEYKTAAIKAADHYADRHLDMQEPYWGGTLDARCEDKEGAWAGFQAFLAVYELTGEKQYLNAAEHAMDVTLSYTVTWDIDMPPGRLRDHDLKTRGWTIVSAQNQHLDVYGVLYTPEIYRMGEHLNRDDLKKLALVMYRTCGQMIDPQGSQGEQLNHTNFVQGMDHLQKVEQMRGTYREDWTVYWMTAHFLNAAAQFVEMGVPIK